MSKQIAFQNANLRDPDGAVVPVTVILQLDGSYSLPIDSKVKSVDIPFTSGSGGNVIVVSATPINGYLYEVYIEVGSSGSSLGVAVDIVQDSGYTRRILTVTNVSANTAYYPRFDSCSVSGVVVTGSGGGQIPMHGTITITITGAGDAKSGTVHVTVV
jgi:hypothetical protein